MLGASRSPARSSAGWSTRTTPAARPTYATECRPTCFGRHLIGRHRRVLIGGSSVVPAGSSGFQQLRSVSS
eukprot:2534403-Alexandrium_andersonii.AAC.1